jgi:hypothetical protein
VKNQLFRRFLILCSSMAALCIGITFGIQKLFIPEKSFTGVFFVIPFVMVITVVFHFVLMKASMVNPRNFVGKFVAFSGIKLMIYLIVILVYAFTIKSEIVIFLLSFLITYVLFTTIEISAILKFLKKSGS